MHVPNEFLFCVLFLLCHRVTLVSVNDQRQVIHSQTTNIKSFCLDRNEETPLMILDKELVFPLYISLNLMVVSPQKSCQTTDAMADALPTTTPISNIGSNSSKSVLNESAESNTNGSAAS